MIAMPSYMRHFFISIFPLFFFAVFFIPSATHAATTFAIPVGETVSGETCQSLDNKTESEADVIQKTGGKCTLTFTDKTSMVETFNLNDNGTPTLTTQFIDVNGKETSRTTATWAATPQAIAAVKTFNTDFAAAAGIDAGLMQAASTGGDPGVAAPVTEGIAKGEDPSSTCNPINIGQCFKDALWWILQEIVLLFLFFFNFLVGLFGKELNWIIYITIFQFGNIIGNNAGLLAAWRVLRDIGNIILLFGFVFMGISTILNLPGNEFTARKALPTLIIFALLMNFSLFAAEAVIDVSNAIGTAIYKEAAISGCSTTDATCIADNGLGAAVQQLSGMGAIFDPNKVTQVIDPSTQPLTKLMILLGLTLFAIITAFVFISAVIMFVIRLVVLAFVMVTSPIGFAGMAIPPLHEMAASWWRNLLKQSFFAPLYLLMVLISLKFMEGIIKTVGSINGGNGAIQNLANVFSVSGASNVSILITFLLIMGFMLAAVKIAQDMGAIGAGFATSRAGAASFGVAGFIGRRTIGYASYRGADLISRQKWARKGLFRPVASVAINTLEKGSNSSFDLRTNAAVKKAAAGNHIDLGTPGTAAAHGFHGIEQKAIKERTDYANKLKQTAQEKELTDEMERVNENLERQKDPMKLEWEHRNDEFLARIAEEERAGNEPVVRQLKADRAAAEKRHKDSIRAIDRQINANKGVINTNNTDNAKREFAKNMQHSGFNWPSVDALANHHAAEQILKGLKKSDNQKVVDAIGSLGGKIGNGGGTAAPGGGGTH